MITFFAALAVLIGGYFVYSKVAERIFGADMRATPAAQKADGVDYVPMKKWRVFLIQLLNIAGLGPIYGALLGALWGPQVFLWIVFGTLLAGGVHDYLSGMISMRHDGASISEVVGIYLGRGMKQVMRVFSVALLVLVGTVFMTGPAGLLAKLTPQGLNVPFWLVVILLYYFLATMLPIDKVIGRIYPVFGIALIVMALGIGGGILIGGYHIPELTFANQHPDGLPVWAMMFVTVACGAISGFHATQSPMMARCVQHEREGRQVFYGAMVAEGVIALIWAAAGVAFYETTGGLSQALAALGGQGGVVYDIATGLLGPVGGVLAMIGVIACPITSGDTAFRSARLTLADWLHMDQKPIAKRLALSLPLLAAGALLSQINFDVVWRYFSWSNQTLAMMALWAGAVYLHRYSRYRFGWGIAAVPAVFMSAVSMTYILQAPEGFRLSAAIAYPCGVAFAALTLALFCWYMHRRPRQAEDALQQSA
nr:carbon starvation protein A [Maliibacterium massiliense]